MSQKGHILSGGWGGNVLEEDVVGVEARGQAIERGLSQLT